MSSLSNWPEAPSNSICTALPIGLGGLGTKRGVGTIFAPESAIACKEPTTRTEGVRHNTEGAVTLMREGAESNPQPERWLHASGWRGLQETQAKREPSLRRIHPRPSRLFEGAGELRVEGVPGLVGDDVPHGEAPVPALRLG